MIKGVQKTNAFATLKKIFLFLLFEQALWSVFESWNGRVGEWDNWFLWHLWRWAIFKTSLSCTEEQKIIKWMKYWLYNLIEIMHVNNLKIDAQSVNERLSFSFFSVLVYFRSTKWQYLVIQIKLVLKFWPWRRKEIHLSFLSLY